MAACLAMDRDPEVTRFVDGPWSDPAVHRAFVEARTRGPYPAGLGYWAVLRRESGGFLGWVLLIPLDARGPEVEIGWRIRRGLGAGRRRGGRGRRAAARPGRAGPAGGRGGHRPGERRLGAGGREDRHAAGGHDAAPRPNRRAVRGDAARGANARLSATGRSRS
jgi:hypothetical protein